MPIRAPVLALAAGPGRTGRQHCLPGRLDLVHGHVEVELLRVRRIWPPRGLAVPDLWGCAASSDWTGAVTLALSGAALA
jgi:hypothetical protein